MDIENCRMLLRHLYELREGNCLRPIDFGCFGLTTGILSSCIFEMIAAGWCEVCGDGKHHGVHDIQIKITPEGIDEVLHSGIISVPA